MFRIFPNDPHVAGRWICWDIVNEKIDIVIPDEKSEEGLVLEWDNTQIETGYKLQECVEQAWTTEALLKPHTA